MRSPTGLRRMATDAVANKNVAMHKASERPSMNNVLASLRY